MNDRAEKAKVAALRKMLLNQFPSCLAHDVAITLDIIRFGSRLPGMSQLRTTEIVFSHPESQKIILRGEPLHILRRIYFNEPALGEEEKLSELQKTILHCIYLRHHDGYIRQRRLELLRGAAEYFVIPFTFQLLGEYVIEILSILNAHVASNLDKYVYIANENPYFWQLTQCRIISYWNEYYRNKWFNIEDYIGHKIMRQIDSHRSKYPLTD